jgi:acetyl esterase/lipase
MRAGLLLISALLVEACASDGQSSSQPDASSSGGASTPASGSGGSVTPMGGAGGAPSTSTMADALVDSTSPADAGSIADAVTGGPAVPYEPAPTNGFVEMNLFPGAPPNFRAGAPKETIEASGRIHDVSVPTLRRYPLDEGKATGTAFVVFPGGGYQTLNMEGHAAAIAQRLGPLGIAVFGLKYRVGAGTTDAPRDALLDAKRAIRTVRSKAAQWAIDPKRLGVISYSAGSHLDMSLVSGFDLGDPASADPIERQSCRPDFVASMCTWNFGSPTSPFKFTADAPPVFLCHAQDDAIAPIALAFAIEQQLKSLGVLEHLEVYPSGGHTAFRVGEPTATGRNWPDKFLPWLKDNHLTP